MVDFQSRLAEAKDMTDQDNSADSFKISVASVRHSVDGWYKETLVVLDQEADVALVKLAKLETEAMRLRTVGQRHESRAVNAVVAREITPLLEMIERHARWLQRASSIRRGG